MLRVKQNIRAIYFVFFAIGIVSCAVVKTPYKQTSYYRNTISRLDSLGSNINRCSDSLLAGFAKVSITPTFSSERQANANGVYNKIPIAGYGQFKTKYATGIHDSIFVKAVALRVDNQVVAIVGADLLIMPTNIIDCVVLDLEKKGINRNQLFFTATHSHSSIGGWGYGVLSKLIAGKRSRYLEKWLSTQISKAVTEAISNLQPAKIGTGYFNGARYTRNRLTGDSLAKNNDFSYVLIEQRSGKRAVIGSFSAHATTLGRKNTLISGDYPGYWERKVEEDLSDLAIFCGGSMGSQAPKGKGEGFDYSKNIGESLADSLARNFERIQTHRKIDLSTLSLKIDLPEYHMRMSTKRNLTTGVSKFLMPLPENVYLQALQINNLVWIFTPCDFSGELAVQIKKGLLVKGFQAIITSFNGSYVGYIIPSKYFNLDKSESKDMGWFGPFMGDYTMELIDRITNTLIK